MRVIIFVLFSTTNTKLYLLKPLSILIKAFIIYSYLYYVSSHFFDLVFLNNVLVSLFYLHCEYCPYTTYYLLLFLSLFIFIFVLFSNTNTKLYLLKPLSILIKAFIIYSYLYYVSSHFFALVFLNNVLDSLFYLQSEKCP